mmetsp:Transcript_8443/g.16812  ORF Transcript_8443/g.16812 Transcript_8443/m.16812 type:complete len:423 (+) Transcript_8443:85-1353(+)|eukprot:CAMPEP_0171568576 /NCGR_PEP_ID=MMETSP0961-20121227/1844_1 /TAXON_ID=87120 /ORGANISM="Aurantiochytrium limacinum, Strain ATCCMYA-1381" /LENGTH=422 /DNA_ID=CAMNT_0012122727 /DNA_START=38 /DNA_END=1306 /DNA_ORIENTATION=+
MAEATAGPQGVQVSTTRISAQDQQRRSTNAADALVSSAPWPPSFQQAGQPDMVLAVQKDAYYRQKVREQFLSGFDVLLEPYQSVVVMPEVKLLAELTYFMLTTGQDKQTLGEEYVDIIPVVRDKLRNSWDLPRKLQKLALLFFGVIAPYMVQRIESGGWKSLAVLFQKPMTAAERAAEMRRKMLERARQQTPAANAGSNGQNGSSQIDIDAPKPNLRQRLVDFYTANRDRILWLLSWSEFLYKVHLAIFYLRGTFYELPKRLAGFQYVFSRVPKSDRPSYRILGWFILAQLAIEAAPAVRHSFQTLLFSWGVLAKRPNESGEGDANSKDRDEIVPSLPTADSASQDLEDLDLVVLRDKKHERGMEHIKCGICLSPVENGACPPCGHMYCYEHIVEAVAVKSECPLCRQACTPSDIMCVYFTL